VHFVDLEHGFLQNRAAEPKQFLFGFARIVGIKARIGHHQGSERKERLYDAENVSILGPSEIDLSFLIMALVSPARPLRGPRTPMEREELREEIEAVTIFGVFF